MKNRAVVRLVLVALAFLSASAGAQTLPPAPQTHVSDQAGLLSSQTRSSLELRLAQFERETSNQILVATFPAVPDGFALEDFTQRAAEAWGAGTSDRDNGAILFVFPNERKMRIEVGYGLEGAIPDITARRIIDGEIGPLFRQQRFDEGISRGVDALMRAARGEYQGTGRTIAEGQTSSFNPDSIALLVFLAFVILSTVLSNKRAGRRGSYFGPGGRREVWGPPFGGGGGFGGSHGGGFGGGGGFSGGGGSFGGGGASGSW